MKKNLWLVNSAEKGSEMLVLYPPISNIGSVVISQPGEQSFSSGSPFVVNVTDGEELEGPSSDG